MANRSYDKAAVEFFAQAENIEYVFEIVDRFEDVKNFLHQKFWDTLAQKLEEQIKDMVKNNFPDCLSCSILAPGEILEQGV